MFGIITDVRIYFSLRKWYEVILGNMSLGAGLVLRLLLGESQWVGGGGQGACGLVSGTGDTTTTAAPVDESNVARLWTNGPLD